MTNPQMPPSDVPLWPEEARPAPAQPAAAAPAPPAEPTPGNPLWDQSAATRAAAASRQPSGGSFSLPPDSSADTRRSGAAAPPPPPAAAATPAPGAMPFTPPAAAEPDPAPPAALYGLPSYESSREPYDPAAASPGHRPAGEVWQPRPLPPATTGGKKVLRVFRISFGLLLRGIGRMFWALGRLIERWGLTLAPPRRK